MPHPWDDPWGDDSYLTCPHLGGVLHRLYIFGFTLRLARRQNRNRRWDSRPMSKTKGRKGGLEGMRNDDGLVQRVSSARRRSSNNTRKQKLTRN
jgi:hypothetical protein